jgi:hypothetical protein
MENPNNPFIMPLQGKFGLSEGLEGSLGVDYIFEDHNGNTGLDRPVLAIKYADSGMGAGGFIALTLPIGFEEILNAGNFATFTLGGLYGKRWGDFGLLANASYSYSTEDEDENKRDQVDFFAKPGYSLPFSGLKSRNQDFQINLGLRYTYGFNHVVGGEGLDTEDHLFTVQPGVHYLRPCCRVTAHPLRGVGGWLRSSIPTTLPRGWVVLFWSSTRSASLRLACSGRERGPNPARFVT